MNLEVVAERATIIRADAARTYVPAGARLS
jgi:hypothetical protein